ncbi:MAG: hypothetical protein ACJAYN_000883 [Bermanella sp.]|jgi:hypothetical protein
MLSWGRLQAAAEGEEKDNRKKQTKRRKTFHLLITAFLKVLCIKNV